MHILFPGNAVAGFEQALASGLRCWTQAGLWVQSVKVQDLAMWFEGG